MPQEEQRTNQGHELLEKLKKIIEEAESLKGSIEDNLRTSESGLQDVKVKQEELVRIYNEIAVSNPDNPSISEKIKNADKEIQNIKTDIKDYSKSLLGSENSEGKYEDGLKQEFDSIKADLKKFQEDQIKKSSEAFNRINSLVAGATTVALAKAFNAQKRSYWLPNMFWTILFIFSVGSIVVFGAVTWNELGPDKISNLSASLSTILSRSPFFLGAIWLGYFAGKQQGQNKRLEQEYAYREALATSYVGFKKELVNLEQTEEDKQVSLKLQNSLVEAFKLSPSDILDNPNNSDEPFFAKLIASLAAFKELNSSKKGKGESET